MGETQVNSAAVIHARRVLFVDDEQSLLGLLKAVFGKLADDWEVQFANGGEEALGFDLPELCRTAIEHAVRENLPSQRAELERLLNGED